MTRISLTVNGEARQVDVEPRTQLAAVLRDHLRLTGTHLACEQGICGACTVLVDGKPIRSCITYAPMHDGARIETIEGFQSDPTMIALRRAFAENHALQCGFCTPGMIIIARDIILRLNEPDEKRIRNELSGNICRCTGYVGIVNAISAVISERRDPASPTALSEPRAVLPALAPFELSESSLAATQNQSFAASRGVTIENGWTSVNKSMNFAYPPDQVWSLFADVERVASCIPGATIRSMSGDSFAGDIAIRFGVVKAAFEGEGERSLDPRERMGKIDARGKDASGQSNVRGQLNYRLTASAFGAETQVDVGLRFQLKGQLAQFNRPDLVEGFLDVVLSQFASACDATLAGKTAARARELSAFSLFLAVARRKLPRFF